MRERRQLPIRHGSGREKRTLRIAHTRVAAKSAQRSQQPAALSASRAQCVGGGRSDLDSSFVRFTGWNSEEHKGGVADPQREGGRDSAAKTKEREAGVSALSVRRLGFAPRASLPRSCFAAHPSRLLCCLRLSLSVSCAMLGVRGSRARSDAANGRGGVTDSRACAVQWSPTRRSDATFCALPMRWVSDGTAQPQRCILVALSCAAAMPTVLTGARSCARQARCRSPNHSQQWMRREAQCGKPRCVSGSRD